MKFVLVEEEIKQAIKEYVAKLITVAPGVAIEVDVKNTRGADGVTAEIDVSLVGATSIGQQKYDPAVAPAQQVKREAAPAPAAAKPAPVAPPVEPEVPTQPEPETIGQPPVVEPEPEIPEEPDALEEEPLTEPEAPPAAGKSIFG